MSEPDEAGRELYIWWKTRSPEAAMAAARALQVRLLHQVPGLTADLLQREGGRDGSVTLMEIYGRSGGIDARTQALIESQGHAALAAWVEVARTSEVFWRIGKT